jgi:adenylate kinase family enzyme
MNQPINIIFIGRSGCGKGTQAELLQKYLEARDGAGSCFYVYTGEKFRSLIKREDLLSARFLKDRVIDKGEKAPDFLAIWAWGSRFVEEMDDHRHVLMDGSPRTLLEALMLDDAFAFYDRKNIYPIFLDVSSEVVIKRMKLRARSDDTDSQIKNRLAFYDEYVVPAVEYYDLKSKNKLIHINGDSDDREAIHRSILKALGI